MNTKLVLTLVVCLAMVPTVAADAHAFSLFGFDFAGIGEFIGSFMGASSQEEDKTSSENKNSTTKKTTTPSNTTKKPPVDYTFTIANVTYKESEVKAIVNNDESLKGYIQSFGYECLSLSITPSPDLTVTFNVDSGKIKKIRGGLNCETTIEVEEALIVDIQQNGFQASKAGDYMSQSKIPTSMYFKALRVFTVG